MPKIFVNGSEIYVSPKHLSFGVVHLTYPEQRGPKTDCEDCGHSIEEARGKPSIIECKCGATYKVL